MVQFMLTTDDIKKLAQKFATKKDLEKFATKKDLEKFVTKKDLEGYATKLDLAKLEVDMKVEFVKIREEMATKDDFRKVMTVLDKVLKEVLVMRQEQTMHVEDHRRINERFKAIEKVSAVAQHLAR